MRTDEVRTDVGLDGSGVTVGTLSDSYACLSSPTSEADDVASGDLPDDVIVLAELDGCTGAIDEGRAMIQLIHDVAPGADQLFHTAFNGYADFAQGIVDLADAGADVIVDDIIYFAEPMFQDGIIAQAVDEVVVRGVPCFSSAGNSASQSYESVWRPVATTLPDLGPEERVLHDFDPGPGVDVAQRLTIPAGGSVTIVVQWDDPSAETGEADATDRAGPERDVDAYLVEPTTGAVVTAGVEDNIASGWPVEFLGVTNNGATAAPVDLVLERFAGADPGLVKYVWFGSLAVDEFGTGSPTSYGHANAAGARAVAAAYYLETPEFGQSPALPEPFTSLGGVPILFGPEGDRLPSPELRLKPEITAPDGTDTTFFGFDSDTNGFPNFFGTSAAAPHAAALAALLLEYDPALAPAEIYAALEENALDMESVGFDPLTGYGLVDAVASLASLAPRLSLASGAATPGPLVQATAGEEVVALQLRAVAGGDLDIDLRTMSVQLGSIGRDGGLADVRAVSLYEDADGDGVIDLGAVPFASGVPDASGDVALTLAPARTVAAGGTATWLVALDVDDTIGALPASGPAWAIGVPLLLGIVGLGRRRRVAHVLVMASVALLLTACPGPGSNPLPEPEARFTVEVTSATATRSGAVDPIAVVGTPLEGSTVVVRE
jgi:hypothetical protein